MKTLAARLSWARSKMGISQEVLARMAGVSQSTIGNLEAGTRLTARRIAAIANALEVDSYWLSEGKGSPNIAQPSSPHPSADITQNPSAEAIRIAKAFDQLNTSAQKEAVRAQLRAFGVLA